MEMWAIAQGSTCNMAKLFLPFPQSYMHIYAMATQRNSAHFELYIWLQVK